MDVLFEYRGSRRPLTIASGDSVTQCVSNELHLVGRSGARVVTADTDLSGVEREGGRVYVLQRWSPQWGCYVDVSNVLEVNDGDRLTVIAKPKPPSKFLLLCCGCYGAASETRSNVKGVPKNKQKRVCKNEEIQSLDYKFTVDSEANSEWGESQSITENSQQDGTLESGERYIRGPSGRAAWKLVASREDLGCDEENSQPSPEQVDSENEGQPDSLNEDNGTMLEPTNTHGVSNDGSEDMSNSQPSVSEDNNPADVQEKTPQSIDASATEEQSSLPDNDHS